ncbi:SurA N-terminal domain-containing protein [Bacillota bacterium LX-D]|nr:SurA N-terminal domain-containing protein [Bacillota bacterium LX-D]
MKKIKRWYKLGSLLILAVFLLAGCGQDYVAKVNNTKITRLELDKRVQQMKSMYEMQGFKFEGDEGKELLKTLEQQVLNQMIQETVLKQEAKKENLKVDKKKVQDELNGMKKLYGEKQFAEMLKSQKITEAEVKESIETNFLFEQLFNKVTEDVKVTDQEAKNFFNKYKDNFIKVKVSHILAQAKAGEANEAQLKKAEARAKVWIEKLNAGADFAALAKKESDEPAAKTSGGALDQYFSMSNSPYDAEFTAGALKIAKGKISEKPVKSSFGYHVIKVIDRQDQYEQLKEDVKKQLLDEQKNEKFDQFFNDAMKKAKIENKLEKEKTQRKQDTQQKENTQEKESGTNKS